MTGSPFGSWNGVEPHPMFPGVSLHAAGGEQVLMCRVAYEPGTKVARHSHEATEQVMYIVAGDVTLTVGEETRELRGGDVCVINRGIDHELESVDGCQFIEALSPVPRDHVPDSDRDLVLGALGDSLHVDE